MTPNLLYLSIKMSLTPSSLLARLEELKKWQEKQQERLLQQQLSRTDYTNASSNFNTIEGLSEFDLSVDKTRDDLKSTRSILSERNANLDSHKVKEKGVGLVNTFTSQKECNSEVVTRNSTNGLRKPKKPFLKRGSGLVRYKMTPGDQKRPFNKIRKSRSDVKTNRSDGALSYDEDVKEMTPLKRPDINVKAVWFKVGEGNHDIGKKDITNAKDVEYLSKKTVLQINKFAAQTPNIETNPINTIYRSNVNEYLPILDKEVNPLRIEGKVPGCLQIDNGFEHVKSVPIENVHSEQSLYEQQLERELLIFEALEEKAMNSSFSSTNSSVLHILSSTPSKIKTRNLARNFMQEKLEKQSQIVNDIIEEADDDKFVDNKDDNPIESDKINSLESSVTSEDFQDKSLEKLEFNDDIPWSDINTIAYTRENSSLSSASTKSENSERESTLVSLPVTTDNNVANNEIDETKDILTKKLKELDEEIQNFRKENAKLQKAKLQLEKQEREFKKEKKAFEKYVLEEKINVEFYLEDEKKKLTKEKMVFERYVKDVQNKTTRKEREEIATLKEELANLREASKLKEARNATSQARLRNQIKSFEKEITNLREELENLRKRNAKLLTTQNFSKKSMETKMLHEINKNLSKLTKDAKVTEQLKKMENSIEKTKVLVNSLDVPEDVKKDSVDKDMANDFFYGQIRSESKKQKDQSELDIEKDLYKNYQAYLKDPLRTEVGIDKIQHALEDKKGDSNKINTSIERNYEMIFGKNPPDEVENNTSLASNRTINETTLPNGSQEITYPNGNVKTISSDGNSISMKYYNGDIKETTLLDGVIRYYYAESESWQTTMADGTEILEFPTGQVEKKFKDGTNEVKFPNDIIRVTKPDGSQIISYPDNTKIDIDVNGGKVIYLPNGQKEIHNTEHMRREYPDGTVKMVYPDGIEETRYSNGRIRIKDKDGNLLLDSYDGNI